MTTHPLPDDYRKQPIARAIERTARACAGAAVAGLLAIAPPVLAAEKMLQVTTRWQETSQWCWAASGQMIMEFIGTNSTPPQEAPQCYQANQAFGRTDCCSCPTPPYVSENDQGCVRPGWPDFNTWGFNSTQTNWGTAMSWPQVKSEINAGRPFMLSWAWHGGGGHAMVGIGYRESMLLVRQDILARQSVKRLPSDILDKWPPLPPIRRINWVMINNPWPPQGRCGPGGNAAGPFGGDFEIATYATFVGGASYDHDHGSDIYNITHH